jgi:Skp family chaperone for outer membrane proteins
MKTVRLLVIGLFALAVTGCDQLGGGRSGVAVIDLDAVGRALGRDEVIAQQINQANQQLTSQLGQVAQDLQQQLEEEREKYEVVGDEARAELDQKTAVANQRLQQTQRLAQQRAQEFRTAVINEFRNEVQPYASEIARERGAVAVVTVATPMLWFDAEVDITDEVIAAMRKAGLERTGEASSGTDAAPQADTGAAEETTDSEGATAGEDAGG